MQRTHSHTDAKSDLAVIVVSFNTRQMVISCIESILQETRRRPFEIIVFDNASADGTADDIRKQFPDIRLIASEQNLGFAAANNLAAGEAQGKYLLLLNPDTVVLNGAIDRLMDFAEKHPEAGIFGGRTVFEDRSLNATSCWRAPSLWGFLCRALGLDSCFRSSSLFNRDAYGGWQRDSVREVDIVSGCFLLIRREIWEELGGFDRDFFMYAEDWDLCLRARTAGYRCLFCPDAEIIHYGGASETVLEDKMVRLLETKVRLCRKHWSPARAGVAATLLDLWVLTRIAGYGCAGLFGRARRAQFQCWKSVWARRAHWHGA
ncbi:MAG: glycosyltransferase family 2 protein [Phycisphaerales bacterium]|nr:glycosyltransferase family 2 protein [Phycisphaerales bacterium]